MKCIRVKSEQIKYTKVKSKDERDILLKDHIWIYLDPGLVFCFSCGFHFKYLKQFQKSAVKSPIFNFPFYPSSPPFLVSVVQLPSSIKLTENENLRTIITYVTVASFLTFVYLFSILLLSDNFNKHSMVKVLISNFIKT